MAGILGGMACRLATGRPSVCFAIHPSRPSSPSSHAATKRKILLVGIFMSGLACLGPSPVLIGSAACLRNNHRPRHSSLTCSLVSHDMRDKGCECYGTKHWKTNRVRGWREVYFRGRMSKRIGGASFVAEPEVEDREAA